MIILMNGQNPISLRSGPLAPLHFFHTCLHNESCRSRGPVPPPDHCCGPVISQPPADCVSKVAFAIPLPTLFERATGALAALPTLPDSFMAVAETALTSRL